MDAANEIGLDHKKIRKKPWRAKIILK